MSDALRQWAMTQPDYRKYEHEFDRREPGHDGEDDE